jgi:hypothetical protein
VGIVRVELNTGGLIYLEGAVEIVAGEGGLGSAVAVVDGDEVGGALGC